MDRQRSPFRKYLPRFRNPSDSRYDVANSKDKSVPPKTSNPLQEPGLHPLSDGLLLPGETRSEVYGVDIVAIHGLNGTADKSWTDERTGNFWLQDDLPRDIPGARIFTYSYQSKMLLSRSEATINDYAQALLLHLQSVRKGQNERAIIFIAHSLGGIVCKEALKIANQKAQFEPLLDQTRGVIFFGTPHRGARDPADSGIFFGDIVQVFCKVSLITRIKGGVRLDLVKCLKANSPDLRRIADEFAQICENFQIVTVVENETQLPLNKLVVDPDSAILNLPREHIIPSFTCHREMCRFSGSSDKAYILVRDEILEICKKACYDPPIEKSKQAFVEPFYVMHVDEHILSVPQPVDGTCEWVLKSPEFKRWTQETQSSLLWVTGHAGAGKTVLSRYIIEHLGSEEGFAKRKDTIICSFFCDNGLEHQRNARDILQRMIFQILSKRRNLTRHAERALGRNAQNINVLQSYNRLWSLLKSILNDHELGPVIIVIDALDECEKTSRDLFLEDFGILINHMRFATNKSIRVLITSRPYLLVDKRLISNELDRLSLENAQDEIDKDLRLVIKQRLNRLGERVKAPESTIDSLERLLNEKADRTFLWVAFALDNLDKRLLTSPDDHHRILADLPHDMSTMYEGLFREIPIHMQDFAHDLLRIILVCLRPLSVDEVNHFVSFRKSCVTEYRTTASLKEKGLHRDITADINKAMGSLVRISNSKVYLVHITLKEFLCPSVNESLEGKVPSRDRINLRHAELSLASACATYLSLDDFTKDIYTKSRSIQSSESTLSRRISIDEDDLESEKSFEGSICGKMAYKLSPVGEETCARISRKYPFFEYAATYWAQHYENIQQSAGKDLQSLALRLVDRHFWHVFSNWFTFYYSTHLPFDIKDTTVFDPVLTAEYFGHHTSVEIFLDREEHTYSQESLTYALNVATRRQDEKIVKRLLQTNVLPEELSWLGQSPLCSAAALGSLSIVKALAKDSRVNINFTNYLFGGTPLCWAASNGNVDIVRFLLSLKAIDVEAQIANGHSPLWEAVSENHIDVAQVLTKDSRVNINSPRDDGTTPFCRAAQIGDEAMVKMLLAIPSVDTASRNETGRTPLAYASMNGHRGVIVQLKSCGRLDKSHSHKDMIGRNAISLVAEGGFDETLKLLLKLDMPGIDEADNDGKTPLFWAIEANNDSTVKILVKTKRVNINHRNQDGRTPLSWAISHGSERTVQLLLACDGIDLHRRDYKGLTPLDWSRKSSKIEIGSILEKAMR